MEDTQPSVPTHSGRRAAQRLTRSLSRRITGLSRGVLTSPARHTRVLTSLASAIHTRPPWVWTRIAAAWTGPRAQGGSTRGAWTAWPWCPARAHQAASGRSSNPNGHDERWQWAAVRQERAPERDAFGWRPQAVAGRPCRRGAGLAARRTDEALVLTCVETTVALADWASGRAREMGAADACGVQDRPPGVAGEPSQEA